MKLFSGGSLALVLAAALALGMLALAPPSLPGPRDALFAAAAPEGVAWDAIDARVSDRDTHVLAWAIDLSTQNVNADSYSTNRAFRFTDGGTTWTDMGPMPYAPGDLYWDGGDPVGLFTSGGVAYFASLARAPDGSEGVSLIETPS